jgi:uncharacterized protein DUF6544
MRYLAELGWPPHAIAANRELAWRDVDDRTVEVECGVADAKAAVRWGFDVEGDLVRATGVRPFPLGKSFVPRRWGGDCGEYEDFAGTRVPSFGEAWWEMSEGRFVYWRGRITALELVGELCEQAFLCDYRLRQPTAGSATKRRSRRTLP